MIILLETSALEVNFESPTFIVPLDASGGSVFLNLIRPAMLD